MTDPTPSGDPVRGPAYDDAGVPNLDAAAAGEQPVDAASASDDAAATTTDGPRSVDAASDSRVDTLDAPKPGGSTRAPLAEGEEPEPTRIERAKSAYDLVSDILTPQTLFILVAAAIIGITGLLGGWNNVATVEQELPAAQVGDQVNAEPFQVTITGARVVDEFKPLTLLKDPKKRYVMVSFVATNSTDRSLWTLTLKNSLALESPDIDTSSSLSPTVYRALDGQPQRRFQPGMAGKYVAVWEQDATEPAPTEVRMRVDKLTYRLSSIDGSTDWRDPEPVAIVTVPVEQEQP